jgi:hypothetical protein
MNILTGSNRLKNLDELSATMITKVMLNRTDTQYGDLVTAGYTILENVFTDIEVDAIIHAITSADQSNPLFRKT